MTKDHEIVQKTIETTKQQLKEGELLPTFFVGSEESFDIVCTPFTGASLTEVALSKDRAAFAVRKMALENHAKFVLFVSEIWTLEDEDAHEDFAKNRNKYPDVASHPKAVDAVMFQLETFSGTELGTASIGPHREMGEIKWLPTDSVQGRLTNFLPKRNG
jgi:hypothetical protein